MGESVTFEVLQSQWGAGEDDVYEGGLHEDVPLTDELAPLLAGAEAAGIIVVHDEISKAARKQLAAHVESQGDSEIALNRAFGDWVEPVYDTRPDGSRTLLEHGYWTGAWQHGNLAQFVVSCTDRLGYDDQLTDDDEDKLDAGDRAALEHALEKAQAQLDKTEEPT